jgi:hypothetical protein
MKFEAFSFGSLRVDDAIYDWDLVIDRGNIRKRKKKPSQQYHADFGHTPLSLEEKIPWKCRRLVIGTGAYGALPVMKAVRSEAKRRKVELLVLPTVEAVELLNGNSRHTNAILHVTC